MTLLERLKLMLGESGGGFLNKDWMSGEEAMIRLNVQQRMPELMSVLENDFGNRVLGYELVRPYDEYGSQMLLKVTLNKDNSGQFSEVKGETGLNRWVKGLGLLIEWMSVGQESDYVLSPIELTVIIDMSVPDEGVLNWGVSVEISDGTNTYEGGRTKGDSSIESGDVVEILLAKVYLQIIKPKLDELLIAR